MRRSVLDTSCVQRSRALFSARARNRARRRWIALGLTLALGAIGCADEGVGDPCTPETIPCDENGQNCGYKASEAYIEASSVQCRSRLCIVYKLENGTMDSELSDPRNECKDDDNDDEFCLDRESLLKSVYCTCRCGTPAGAGASGQELCDCPSGFTCQEILNIGGAGIVGSYCIRK